LDPQPADRLDERQSRADSTLGIILVRLRIAEIHEHAVTHVLGNEPVESSDCLRHAFVIGADY